MAKAHAHRAALMAALAALIPLSVSPHDIITTKITYSREVSRILLRRCLGCHAAASSIPLSSYGLVRPWAVGIKEQVLTRQMPPWGAVKGFGYLAPDDGLTQQEIMIISAWVVGGAPEGDPALLSHLPLPVSPETPALKDALRVTDRIVLRKALVLAGIRPVGTLNIASARIAANFPDGHIEPLLWLFHYQAKWRRNFQFRTPIALPSGTTIQADSPVRFALQSAQ